MSPKTRRGSSAAAIGRCERGHELGLAGPRAGEDASGCPDAPAGRRRWGCGARWPPLPTSTPATCATSCRRGVSTAPSCNRHRHSSPPPRPPPGRLPGGSRRRSAAAVLGRVARPGPGPPSGRDFSSPPPPAREPERPPNKGAGEAGVAVGIAAPESP